MSASKCTWILGSPRLWETLWLCAYCETEKDTQSENVELAEGKLSLGCRKRYKWNLSNGDTTRLSATSAFSFHFCV